MDSVTYRPPGTDATVHVERDGRLLFWPFRVRGEILVAGTRVERSWQAATLRDALGKAQRNGCIALTSASLDGIAADLEKRL